MGTPSLPQNDKHKKCRNKQLQKYRNRYRFNYNIIPTLGFSDSVPKTEYPRFKWIWILIEIGVQLLRNSLASSARTAHKFGKFFLPIWFRIKYYTRLILNTIATKDPTSFFYIAAANIQKYVPMGQGATLKDYDALFATIKNPDPNHEFLTDENFVRMRIAGWNPTLITSIQSLPSKVDFSNSQFTSLGAFADDSLQNALKEKRIFIVDYKDLENIQAGDQPNGQKFSYAPIALFALDKTRETLYPIAIQCGQERKKFATITPNSGKWTWNIAKTIVNSADGNYHELIAHLGKTHLFTEPFVVATYRQLAKRHPIHRLLVPHFQGTIFINYLAKTKLIAPGGGVDFLLAGEILSETVAAIEVVGKESFNDSMFPKSFALKGVEKDVLKEYPYRDDGLLNWKAIHKWVEDYTNIYYESNKDIQQDQELQLWADEVCSESGGRIKDFGEDGKGKLSTKKYLVDALTNVIFTASCSHASVNFPQRGLMMSTPQAPLATYKEFPVKGKEYTEEDLVAALPPLDMASLQLSLGYTLGGVYYTKLGKYRCGFSDGRVKPFLYDFQKELRENEKIIQERNKQREKPYTYMMPSKIPQSINI
ncbi:MAG: lipoxygenase family protein [Spirochaetota bacterium]